MPQFNPIWSFCIAVLALIISAFNFYFQHLRKKRSLKIAVASLEMNPCWLSLSVGFANSGTESLMVQRAYLSLQHNDIIFPFDKMIQQPDKVSPELPLTLSPKSVSGILIKSEPFKKGIWSNLTSNSNTSYVEFKVYLELHVFSSHGLLTHKRLHIFDIYNSNGHIVGLTPKKSMFDFFAAPLVKLPHRISSDQRHE